MQATATTMQQIGQPMMRKRRLPSSFSQMNPSSSAAGAVQQGVRQPAGHAVPPDALSECSGKGRLPVSNLDGVKACQSGGSGLKPLQLPQARPPPWFILCCAGPNLAPVQSMPLMDI